MMENDAVMENIKEPILKDSTDSDSYYSSSSEDESLSEGELDSDINVIEIDSDVEDKSNGNKLYFKGVKRNFFSGTKNREETSWEAIQNQLLECANFKQLEAAVTIIKEPPLIGRQMHNTFSECNVIGDIALHFLPKDSPTGYLPVKNFGDGNCFA